MAAVTVIDKMNTLQGKVDDLLVKYAAAFAKDLHKQVGTAEAVTYAICIMLTIVGYHIASDGVFSAIVSLASMIQFLGLSLTLVKVQSTGSYGILSVKSLQLYVIVYVLRLACTCFNEGYLPIDCSGDWAYQLADILSLCVCLVLLGKAKASLSVKQEKPFPIFAATLGCALLAVCVHPCHNLGTWSDVSWAASVYLETFVMLPQLRLMAAENSIESLTSHSIACTFLYRAMNFYFWFICRRELVRTRLANEDPFFIACPLFLPAYTIVSAFALQSILLIDFMYYYLRAIVEGSAVSIVSNIHLDV